MQLAQAVVKSEEYESKVAESEKHGYLAGMEGEMKNQYSINEEFREEVESLLIPQFGYEIAPNPLVPQFNIGVGDDEKEFIKLKKEKLSDGFEIIHADSTVNFALSSDDIYSIDITEKGAKYKPMTAAESEYVKTQMTRRTDEGKRVFLC